MDKELDVLDASCHIRYEDLDRRCLGQKEIVIPENENNTKIEDDIDDDLIRTEEAESLKMEQEMESGLLNIKNESTDNYSECGGVTLQLVPALGENISKDAALLGKVLKQDMNEKPFTLKENIKEEFRDYPDTQTESSTSQREDCKSELLSLKQSDEDIPKGFSILENLLKQDASVKLEEGAKEELRDHPDTQADICTSQREDCKSELLSLKQSDMYKVNHFIPVKKTLDVICKELSTEQISLQHQTTLNVNRTLYDINRKHIGTVCKLGVGHHKKARNSNKTKGNSKNCTLETLTDTFQKNAFEVKNHLGNSKQNDNINNSQEVLNLKMKTVKHFIKAGSDCLTTHNESLAILDDSKNQISNDDHSTDEDFNDNSNDSNGGSETLEGLLIRNTANDLEINNTAVTDVVTSTTIESVYKSFQNINVCLNSNERLYCCDLCNKQFNRPYKLKIHKESKCGMIKMFSCNICAKGFTNKWYLTQHFKVVHLFTEKSSLRKRIRTKHEQNNSLPQTCQYCQKTYTSNSNLKAHIRFQHSHISCGNFECAHCSRIFKRKDCLISHIKRTHIADQIKCNICNNPLSSHDSLKKHMQNQHPEESMLMCDFCGKQFKDKCRFNRHLRIHSGEKPFVCQNCGKCFRTEHNLTQHSVIHSERRPFGCNMCSMSFRIKNHLRQHMAVHGMANTSVTRRKNKKNINSGQNHKN